mgnify:CR=1 FL=1
MQICDSVSELESEDDFGDNIASDDETVSSENEVEANGVENTSDADDLRSKHARL